MSMLLTVAAFVVALGLLIAIHEYGHYRVAVACGVRVLRFSIGFGQVLWRWRAPGSGTEFTICAFPLGGYVKMLDEREEPVAAQDRPLAFNNQPLRAQALVVAAGPLANLLLAVLLYAIVHWSGVQSAAPVLARPLAGSVAEQAGLQGGERVTHAGFDGAEAAPADVASFDDVRWWLLRGAMEGQDVRLQLASGRHSVLPLAGMQAREANDALFRRIGLVAPYSRPEIAKVLPGGAAERAGLRQGDVVLRVQGQPQGDAAQLIELIRQARDGQPRLWQIRRDGRELELPVQADVEGQGEAAVGRIQAYVGGMYETVQLRYGPLEGLARGLEKTVDVAALTLRTMGRMLIGEASLKNLSGPLTIADFAGRSASLGLVHYLNFLALISVSLGVLNLLPVPVLDGGHLMYYLWEGVTGRRISQAWLERLQRAGLALLFAMMSIALFNDFVRQWG